MKFINFQKIIVVITQLQESLATQSNLVQSFGFQVLRLHPRV